MPLRKVCQIALSTIVLFIVSGLLISALLSLVPDSGRYGETTAARFKANLITFLTIRFGDAEVAQQPISKVLQVNSFKTAILIGGALILSLGISIPIGLYCARRKDTLLARFANSAVYALSAIPILVWSMLTLVFFQRAAGVCLSWNFLDIYPVKWQILIYLLPMICLAFGDGMLADMTRSVRDEAAKIIEQDFMLALRALNVPVRRHLFRGLFPIIMSIIAGKLAYLLGGAIVVEYIFEWKGLGYTLLTAVSYSGRKDYPMILAATMVFIAFSLFVNVSSSLAAVWADPRLRKG